MTYRCPKCKRNDCLWRDVEVPGWHSIDAELKWSTKGTPHFEADWPNAVPTSIVGCSECGWSGGVLELERVGIDGESLPPEIPGQEAML